MVAEAVEDDAVEAVFKVQENAEAIVDWLNACDKVKLRACDWWPDEDGKRFLVHVEVAAREGLMKEEGESQLNCDVAYVRGVIDGWLSKADGETDAESN